MSKSKVNLENLSLDELQQLQEDVAIAIHDFNQRRKQEAKDALEAKAREFGFSLNELLSDAKGNTKTKSGKVAPKYADPTNPEKTWTGRGRKPKWVEEYLAQGKTLDELKI